LQEFNHTSEADLLWITLCGACTVCNNVRQWSKAGKGKSETKQGAGKTLEIAPFECSKLEHKVIEVAEGKPNVLFSKNWL
jgi:hypothetical protein